MKTARKSLPFEMRLAARRIRSRKVADAKLRARQAQGKLRRFVITNFRKEETMASLALRRGECNRCGACCELVFKCPFLKKNSDGTSLCGIYENRPNSCRLFPIESRDIQEVRGSCTYYFIEKPRSSSISDRRLPILGITRTATSENYKPTEDTLDLALGNRKSPIGNDICQKLSQ